MKTRFLTITLAVVMSTFAAHQAIAKTGKHTTTAASKKHHKKHMKKTADTRMAAPAVHAA